MSGSKRLAILFKVWFAYLIAPSRSYSGSLKLTNVDESEGSLVDVIGEQEHGPCFVLDVELQVSFAASVEESLVCHALVEAQVLNARYD